MTQILWYAQNVTAAHWFHYLLSITQVVANSVTALAEIMEAAPETEALLVTPNILKKLLMALNECTE